MIGELPSTLYVLGFSRRKQKILRRYLPDVGLRFPRIPEVIPCGASVLLWGRSDRPEGLADGVQCIRVEDGFLRSVGLGSDLIHPVSWVFDRQGIYFDATGPSDLETLLAHGGFDEATLARAGRFRARIVQAGLTKYNVGAREWTRPRGVSHVLLVPGQVETDASLRFGAPGIRTNMALLQAVRRAHPDAYVVYKPHPDVLAGLRAEGVGESGALRWCDEVVADVSMATMIDAVDELHVMTSLAGFEALLRDKPVTCHGQPFYAGWGLTNDLMPIARRARKLGIDELIAGALMQYPVYVRRSTGVRCEPEVALNDLLSWRANSSEALPLWRKAFRHVLRVVVGVR